MKAKILRECLGLIIVFLTELQNVSWDFTRVLRTNHENQRLGLISKRVLSSSHDLVKSVVKYNAVLSSSNDLVNSVVNRTTK